MDGLNLKWSGDTIRDYFTMDKFGSLLPSASHLQMVKVARMVDRQNHADTGYFKRISEINYRTDVEFTNNPYGNSPTIGGGYRLFGPRPFEKVRFSGRLDLKPSSEITRRLDKRETAIEQNQLELMKLHESLKPDATNAGEYLTWLVEGDQVMTGGGFDGNSIGEVTKSGLNFVIKGSTPFEYADSQLSALVVSGCKWLRDLFESWGLMPGSLKPEGATQVRLAQESDGMVGWPVYNKALSRLTKEIAIRLLIESGIDSRQFVGSTVVDARDSSRVPYRVVDGLAYILDHSTFSAADVPSIVTLLARIQKHGWKVDGGKLEAKPAKTRSIYPNSALAGIIEAMTIAPFDDKLKEIKAPFMPSLQDKPTRISMVWNMLEYALSKGCDYLPADWSKYDATVKGEILATVMYYCVRPFYNSEWQSWVDFAIYCLVYKYVMMDTRLCELNNDMFSEAKRTAQYANVGNVSIFGLTGGLISGAKFTHVGGSMYGEVVIHYCIPKLIGYEPIFGAQAGDDTLMAYPISSIDLNSVEKTYTPIQEAAAKYGLEMNASKQIWHYVDGELAKIFLQDVYHYKAQVKGIGSIFRPYDAVFFSERNKGLSIAEQLIAEIARMNQGCDNPFRMAVVTDWLKHEEMIGILFKEYGESAFQKIVGSIGLSADELAQRIDVGSFTWGVDRESLKTGNLPILKTIADASAKLDFKLSLSDALRAIDVKPDATENEDISSQGSDGLQTD